VLGFYKGWVMGILPLFLIGAILTPFFIENLLKSLKIDPRLEKLNLLKIVFGTLT